MSAQTSTAWARSGFALLFAGGLTCTPAAAQFVDEFNGLAIQKGWTWFTGDGTATNDFQQRDGYATMLVDATSDHDNIWWALIKRNVASSLDLTRLSQPGHELRVEARVRIYETPRRVHLSANTQKTTDFDEHIGEFDISDTDWHVVSMTTRHFHAEPGDDVNVQFAITDWGLGKYRADIDYYKAEVVDAATAGPDKGEPQRYHPPVPDLSTFSETVRVAHDSAVNLQYPALNLNGWFAAESGQTAPVLTVNGVQLVILRWDLSAYRGKRAAGAGVLDLTTHSAAHAIVEPEELGQVRVTEILAGDPDWDQRTVTLDSLLKGQPLDAVLNPQMIIDERVAKASTDKILASISRPVLQRLLDGRTLGLAIRPLGPVDASFYASEFENGRLAPRLHFNLARD
jgi:hypothetical protein